MRPVRKSYATSKAPQIANVLYKKEYTILGTYTQYGINLCSVTKTTKEMIYPRCILSIRSLLHS